MLAIVLRLLIAIELTLYSALALNCFGLSRLGAAVFALAALLALRVGLTAPPCLYAWGVHSPTVRPGAGRALCMYSRELLAFLLNFVVVSPFERWWMGPDRLQSTEGRPPVLLIHGYSCSRAAWWWMRKRLEKAGWCVATINLEPIYTDIDSYVDPLARRIDEVLAATGSAQIVLVGHSMGGLVARAYLRRHGEGNVRRLVTLGTPHAGSELARLGFGKNARQMEPGNAWLDELGRVCPKLAVHTIFSRQDNYVMPQANLELPGATSREIDWVGHLAMLFSSRVAEALLEGLAASEEKNPDQAGDLRRT